MKQFTGNLKDRNLLVEKFLRYSPALPSTQFNYSHFLWIFSPATAYPWSNCEKEHTLWQLHEERNIYSYDFCFFSCAKSQVKCILVLNIFFIVNNSKFLSQKNIYRVGLMLKTMLGNIQLPSYWTLCFKKLTL